MNLIQKNCAACSGKIDALSFGQIEELKKELVGWNVSERNRLLKEFKFNNFTSALEFVNRIAEVAEREGHHPDIFLSWGRVVVEIWTHSINNLTESDFILAAKIDNLG
jgi:4a-hydroxytetrahydrobiopterin dehydratase